MQITVEYKNGNKSLGLEAEVASVEATIQVVPGPGRALQLQLPHVEQRKCFNAGTDGQRTIVPAARLSVVDE